MGVKTGRNMLLSLIMSVSMTLAFAVLYVFYPQLSFFLTSLSGPGDSGTESSGISAVAGGAGGSFLVTLFLIAALLFAVIFALLQRRRIHD